MDGFDCVAPIVEKFENKEKFVLDCGVTVDLDLNNFILSYCKESELLFADRAPLAYNFEGEFGNGSYHYITREDDEHIFGLGDKSRFIFAKILLVTTVFITIQQTPLLLIWAGKSIIITAISSILRRMTIAWFIMFFSEASFLFYSNMLACAASRLFRLSGASIIAAVQWHIPMRLTHKIRCRAFWIKLKTLI